MLEALGITASLALLIYFAYKGHSVVRPLRWICSARCGFCLKYSNDAN
jgi:hypothetical protein